MPTNHSLGNMPVSKILLNKITYKGHNKSLVLLIYSLTSSIPADLLFLNLPTHFLISASVIDVSSVELPYSIPSVLSGKLGVSSISSSFRSLRLS